MYRDDKKRGIAARAVAGLAVAGATASGVAFGAQAAQATENNGHNTANTASHGVVGDAGLYYFTASKSGESVREVDTTGDHATALAFSEYGMSWSPDGSRFAESDGTHITVYNADGSHPVPVFTASSGFKAAYPHWLSDGSAIAYTLTESGYESVHTVTPDGLHTALVPLPGLTSDFRAFDVLPGGGYLVEQVSGQVGTISVWHPGDTALTQVVQATGLTHFAASPDGRSVAFSTLDSVAKTSTLSVVDLATRKITNIGSDYPAYFLVWSPDSSKLAYVSYSPSLSSPTGLGVAVRDMTTGAVSDEVPTVTSVESIPYSWRPVVTHVQEDRVGGGDRVATAIATSQLGFAKTGAGVRQAQAAVLTRSDTFADALAGGALASDKHGPLLLTGTGSLDPAVAAELTRVLPKGATVYLLGGVNALSDKVFQQVATLGFVPTRVAGQDRDGTAVAIAQQITSTPHTFLVATGLNFPDALAAGAAAGAIPNAVVLLSDDSSLSAETKNYLVANHHSGDVVLGVGNQGSNALASALPSSTITSQFRGHDRFDTATMLAGYFYSGASAPLTVGVATASNWPDALGGGALLGAHPGPLLLAGPGGLSAGENTYLAANSGKVEEIVVFGGNQVVTPSVAVSVGNTIAGVNAWTYNDNRVAPALP